MNDPMGLEADQAEHGADTEDGLRSSEGTPIEEAGLAPEGDAPRDHQLRLALEAEQEENRDLLERLRLALLATEPAIDPALVRGDTAEEVENSFQSAKRMADAIRESVLRERQARIPAGAPGRSPSAPRSAYDKIRSGLARLN